MSSEANGTTVPQQATAAATSEVSETKGKGKAVDPAPDVAMEENDDDEEEEEEEEDPSAADLDEDDEEEEDMQEIEADNIIGSRTRGKTIDYAAAAENMDEGELDDYDEDEDDDFEEQDDDEDMA